MVEIIPPDFAFCPFCATALDVIQEQGRRRKRCHRCNWTYYPQAGASVTAVILRDGLALMVKRRRPPFEGTWMFPSGFVEFGEHPTDAISREVREETGLITTV